LDAVVGLAGLAVLVVCAIAVRGGTVGSLERRLFEAINGRDYIVVQGVTLVVAIAYLVVNLVVDVSYAFLDPRIRLG